MSFCLKCGHYLAGPSRFCTHCGASQPANRAEPPASEPPVAEAAHQPKQQRLPRGWATVAVAAVMAAGISVLLSWRLTDHPATSAPVVAGSPGTPATTGTGETPPSTLRASPVRSASPPAAGNGPVPVSPSAAQEASAGQVAAFLGTYFAAINHRDYQTYISLFDGPARPDRNAREFLSGYRTTTDSDPVLAALTPTSTGEWAATVTFVSHQSPAVSATDSSCTSWNTTLYLEPSGNSYLIGLPPPDYQASRAAC
jgi:hypothetical protein